MTPEMFVVLGLVLGALILFITEKLSIDFVALLVMAVLLLTRIVSTEEGLSGFSNTATVTVGAMFILSAGLSKTGSLEFLGIALKKVFKVNFWLALLLMIISVGVISAFINNTAAVVIFMPLVIAAARESNISSSKLLIPLSFASMFGGVCTLIGTSTNIIVSSIIGLHRQPEFGMFEFSVLGLVFFGTGTLYMMLIGVRLIPSRRVEEELTEQYGMGEYLTEAVVQPEARWADLPLSESPLVKKLEMDILEVCRDGRHIVIPTQETVLKAGDILRLRGNVKKIAALQEEEGIVLKSAQKWRDEDLESEEADLVEAVIAPGSILEGKSLMETRFRNLFGATVLAIRHSGEVMREHLARVTLRAGDALLIEVRRRRLTQLKQSEAFVIVSEVGLPEFKKEKLIPTLAIIFGVVATAALGILPIAVSAVTGCVLLVLAKCLTLEEAYKSIEWKVIFLLAGVLTLGIALEKTGAAQLIAGGIVHAAGKMGPVAIVSGLFLLTSLLTNMMSNNATAALLAPIAIVAAESMGVSPRPFLMAVMFAASSSFMTPVGYQTNILIYGPGRYKFIDFLRVGTPLNLLFWVIGTLLIPRFWSF